MWDTCVFSSRREEPGAFLIATFRYQVYCPHLGVNLESVSLQEIDEKIKINVSITIDVKLLYEHFIKIFFENKTFSYIFLSFFYFFLSQMRCAFIVTENKSCLLVLGGGFYSFCNYHNQVDAYLA